jgi:hypothetical protein
VRSGSSWRRPDANAIDAAARGASEGLGLALNVGAMLLAFIALLALMNGLLGWVTGLFGTVLTIQTVLGWLGAPIAWLMGTPWRDAMAVGTLLGEKTALNEFVAYLHLANMLQTGEELSALRRDRDLRALRLRELQLHRHPDRRHRRARAGASQRPEPSRPARDGGRHAGRLHDGVRGRDPDLNDPISTSDRTDQ